MQCLSWLYLSDCIDKLCRLALATGDTGPVRHGGVHQLRVAGDGGHQVAIVSGALGTPDAAEHGPQLCGVRTPSAGTHKIFGLS